MKVTYQRIKKLRESLKISQEELAIKTGYTSRSSIAKIEAGKVDLTQSKLLAFAEALGTTTGYLMGDDCPDLPSADNIVSLPNTRKIPLIGEIACGEPITAEENVEDIINIPDSIHADFALRCKGDSMIGARIMDGDLVYIRQQPDVDDGEIAAVLIGNEATLKRVYKMPGRLQLRAENPSFLPINLEGDELETVRILGKAVAFTSCIK